MFFRGGALLTMAGADEHEARMARVSAVRDAIRRADISDDELAAARTILLAAWGKEPGEGDVAWSVLNHRLIQKPALFDQKMTLFRMAFILCAEGKDWRGTMQRSHDAGLQDDTRNGLQHVTIMAGACCEPCSKLDGRKFSIMTARAEKPLPPAACTEDWCNCGYSPHVEF